MAAGPAAGLSFPASGPAVHLIGAPPAGRQGARSARRLGLLELATGVAAAVGGSLLAVEPDGSLLSADPKALVGSPFSDWRFPGVLLAGLVGGGFLAAGAWQLLGGRHCRELSVVAGAGLVVFEWAEWMWLGFQPLQAVFAVVGGVIAAAAWRQRSAGAPAPWCRR